MPLFETPRLTIDQAKLKDAAFFYKLLNSPNWIKHIGDRHIKNLADAEKYIQQSLMASYNQNGFGLYKVSLKKGNIAVGICGLLKRSYLQHPDIGFAILPEYESRGLTFEAARATLLYAKTKLELQKILAITDEDNRASQNLLKKLGMKYVQNVKESEKQTKLLLFSN